MKQTKLKDPPKLLKLSEFIKNNENMCYASDKKFVEKNRDKECVIAYYKTPLTCLILVKITKCFLFYKNEFGISYKVCKVEPHMKDFNKGIRFINELGTILDKESFDFLKTQIMINNL